MKTEDFKYKEIEEGIKITDRIYNNLVIPSEIDSRKVVSIGNHAFYKNGLTQVIIPRGIIEIERGAFRDNKLKSVFIPITVTNLDEFAFDDNVEIIFEKDIINYSYNSNN